MTIRFIGATLCGVLLVLATTTGGFAQVGGFTPSASASSRDIAEHLATVRAEVLYAKCKVHYAAVIDGVLWPVAPNSLYAACMRNGGKRI
jgi:hypothetical protein